MSTTKPWFITLFSYGIHDVNDDVINECVAPGSIKTYALSPKIVNLPEMTSCDDASSCCVMANTLGCTVGLSICAGRIGCVEVNASPSLLTLAPVPLPNPEVLPPLPTVL